MNIIVTGSRDHDNPRQVEDALQLHFTLWLKNNDPDDGDIFNVIQGGAKGADAHAIKWCHERAPRYMGLIGWRTYPANWSKYGPSAGPRRNIEMLTQYPDAIVLAFPQGASKGTRHCIREAEKRGMQVKVYESEKKHV